MSIIRPHRITRRLKGRFELRIIRNGETIYRFKRTRDLLVWRGQMIFAYLLSQGAVGTSTDTWQVIASENNVSPDMGDDSGEPLNNEFNPVIGSPVNVSYDFNPTIKPSAGYQTQADLIIYGTVISDRNATLRKIGIIDDVSPPNQHIIFEDAIVPRDVLENDEIYIQYTVPL